MKKIIITIMAVFLLSACGDSSDANTENEVEEEKNDKADQEDVKKDTITKEEFKNYYGKLIEPFYKIMYMERDEDIPLVFKAISDRSEEVTEELKHEYKKDIDGVVLLLSLGETFTNLSSDIENGYDDNQEDVFAKMNEINTDYLEGDLPENLQKEIDEANERIAQEEKEKIPREFKSALNKGQIYAKTMQMSKAGVHDQLVSEHGENFPEEAAQYAMDNIEFDWKENALKKAKTYAETMDMSDSGIYDQLISEHGEKFTEEEAQYAIDNLS